jgi:hypothetical protein
VLWMWANLPTVASNLSVFIWNPVLAWPVCDWLICPMSFKEDRPLIAAIVRDDRLIIPKGDNHLRDGDLVYFISEEKTCSNTFPSSTNTPRR